MASKSFSKTFTKDLPTDEGPFLSLNSKVTADKDLGPEPEEDVMSKMESIDPKLSAEWTIWEQHKKTKGKGADYSDAMKQTVSFATAKEFWGCWNHLPQPSELLDGKKFSREINGERTIIDSLAIFKKGIAPEWEDEQNAKGGHFELKLKPELGPGLIDELWNNIVLGMICDATEPKGMLTGCRLVDKLESNGKAKPVIRIQVWFNEYDQESLSGGQGKVYDLRGSFERCIRLGLDGREKKVSWSTTEVKPHFAT